MATRLASVCQLNLTAKLSYVEMCENIIKSGIQSYIVFLNATNFWSFVIDKNSPAMLTAPVLKLCETSKEEWVDSCTIQGQTPFIIMSTGEYS